MNYLNAWQNSTFFVFPKWLTSGPPANQSTPRLAHVSEAGLTIQPDAKKLPESKFEKCCEVSQSIRTPGAVGGQSGSSLKTSIAGNHCLCEKGRTTVNNRLCTLDAARCSTDVDIDNFSYTFLLFCFVLGHNRLIRHTHSIPHIGSWCVLSVSVCVWVVCAVWCGFVVFLFKFVQVAHHTIDYFSIVMSVSLRDFGPSFTHACTSHYVYLVRVFVCEWCVHYCCVPVWFN